MEITKIDETTYSVDGVQVWVNDGSARCTQCSGPLEAMKKSCKHARAVKRHINNRTRLPTKFETKVLKRISSGRGLLAGDGQVAISAACRRLEKLGYAAKPGVYWYVTKKGDAVLQAETCEFCDTPVNTPNFAYHFCTGRKTKK